MNSIAKVRAYEKDGIEYYVSDDRKITGMSHTGFADFCGVSRQTITRLVENIEDKESAYTAVPECLKTLCGKDLGVQSNTQSVQYVIENNARIIQSQYCWELLVYYALYSQYKQANEIAKVSMAKFGAAGIHTYILVETGLLGQTASSNLEQIMSGIQEELKKLNHLKERDTNLNLHEKDKPGLEHINEEYQNKSTVTSGEYFSLSQWLDKRQMTLARPMHVVFTRRVGSNYRTLVHKEPEKRRAYYYGNPNNKGLVNVYTKEHEPILEAALKYVLSL